MDISVSIAQFDIVLNDPAANLRKVRNFAEEAKRRGSQFILLPELWSTGCDLTGVRKFATPVDAGLFRDMGELAAKHSIYIIGSLPAMRDDKVYNTAAIHGPDGELLGTYDKIHLFPLETTDERRFMAGGDECPVFETRWGPIAIATCFDLRFPELFRTYMLKSAQIIFLPAQWPKARQEHWRLLQRSRALENQLFVVSCNRVGTSIGHEFFGGSAVINPWGETVIESSREETLLTAEIDLDLIAAARTQLPFLEGRREGVYFK